jgi:microsomal epoxide hydrolase
VNLLDIPPPPGVDVEADISAGNYAPNEAASLMNSIEFAKRGTAFVKLDGTRPATAGFVIGSSPVGLLAWIGEKMIAWSDETLETDMILMNVSLYWFSGCYPTSIYHHRLILDDFGPLMDGWRAVNVPLGYSWFKKEIGSLPKMWIAHTGFAREKEWGRDLAMCWRMSHNWWFGPTKRGTRPFNADPDANPLRRVY